MTRADLARQLAATLAVRLREASWWVAVSRRGPAAVVVYVRVLSPAVFAAVAAVAGPRPGVEYGLELAPSVGDDAPPAGGYNPVEEDAMWADAQIRYAAAKARAGSRQDGAAAPAWADLSADWIALHNQLQTQDYPPDFAARVSDLLARADALAAGTPPGLSVPVPPFVPPPGSLPPLPVPGMDLALPGAPPAPPAPSSTGIGPVLLTSLGVLALWLTVTSHRR